uniref:Sensory neuron membrane protein 1 n=1 Tax=Sclerodermus sp. MQW-2015 TaxID=1729718 RepID=A0A0N9JVL5_9HYME|nr:sensory neuron membrane protein 1 [Sclerodermus sp. MQW-2015]
MGKLPLHTKLAIGGVCSFVFGIGFGWMAFPKILRSQIKKQIALKPGSEIRDMWSAFPLPLDFKVHLFNVTNPEEITNGGMPIFNEVGPFFYDEYKEKVELVDRDEDDSLEYKQRVTWVFNPSKSGPGLTEDTEIVFPHMMILAIVMATVKEKPSALGIVGKGVNSIFHNPPSLFVKMKVRELLFTGLPVDCEVADFGGSAICSVLKEEAADLVEERENFYRFSLFGAKNHTIQPDKLRVMRGIKNYKDVGRVMEWREKPEMDLWYGDPCNQFNGTDSTIFPPLMGPEDDIVSFGAEICRSLSAKFQKHSVTKGLKTLRYTADLGDPSSDPDLKCFCETPDTCLTQGLFDLRQCVGAPIIGTLPHFYLTDEKYLKLVKGLEPDESKHAITMDFEPMTATPINGRKRLQFNIMVEPVEKFKLMKNFPSCLFPLFWVEEGILLDDMFVNKVKVVFKAMMAVAILKWLNVLGGLGMCGASGYLYYKNRGKENKLDITKVSPQNGNRHASSEEKKWQQMNISTIQAATVPPNLDRA